ncbi:hypothetical protein D3C83_307360 [compost metagenome]
MIQTMVVAADVSRDAVLNQQPVKVAHLMGAAVIPHRENGMVAEDQLGRRARL